MKKLQVDLARLRRPNWNDQEQKNAAVVADFVQLLMNEHAFDEVKKKYGKNPYVQHNRNMLDGLEGVLKYVSNVVKRYPDYTYDVKRITVDGDLVSFHSHVTTNKKHRGNPNKGFNIMDTWKVEDGIIVEHWDAIQPIHGFMRFFVWLVGGRVGNNNTLF